MTQLSSAHTPYYRPTIRVPPRAAQGREGTAENLSSNLTQDRGTMLNKQSVADQSWDLLAKLNNAHFRQNSQKQLHSPSYT